MEPRDSNGFRYEQQGMLPRPFDWLRQSLSRLEQYAGSCALVGVPAGLLAAILYPAFQPPRPGDASKFCISNEKQIGAALLMYLQDFDERFPSGAQWDRQSDAAAMNTPGQADLHAGLGWAGVLHPYAKNTQMFVCPQVARTMRQQGQPLEKVIEGERLLTLSSISYAYNRNAALNPVAGEFTAPERTVLLTEAQGVFANLREDDEYNPQHTYSPAGNGLTVLVSTSGAAEAEAVGGARYATGILGGYGHTLGCPYLPFFAPQADARHRGSSVYLMADGHTKFLKPNLVSPGDNALAAQSGQDCAHHRAADATHLNGFAVTFSTR